MGKRETEAAATSQSGVTQKTDYGALLRAAKDVEEAGNIVVTALAERLSRALSVPLEDIELTRPVHSYGVDSLVAVELRFWFAREMKVDISVFEILANQDMESLGRTAASKSQHLSASE